MQTQMAIKNQIPMELMVSFALIKEMVTRKQDTLLILRCQKVQLSLHLLVESSVS